MYTIREYTFQSTIHTTAPMFKPYTALNTRHGHTA